MKKIIISMFLLCLMALGASALVQYTGQPQLPYLVYGKVSWNDQMLSGTRLTVTNAGTGFSDEIVTDGNGYYQIETSNWLTSSPRRSPIQNPDKITITVSDGCGTGDICTKSFVAKSEEYADWAEVDFSLTGDLSCPPVSCPKCNCGGGSSVYYKATQALCDKDFPCEVAEECPEEKVCDACPEDTTPYNLCNSCCPTVEEPKDCDVVQDCEETNNTGWIITIIIVGIIAGLVGFFIGKNQ